MSSSCFWHVYVQQNGTKFRCLFEETDRYSMKCEYLSAEQYLRLASSHRIRSLTIGRDEFPQGYEVACGSLKAEEMKKLVGVLAERFCSESSKLAVDADCETSPVFELCLEELHQKVHFSELLLPTIGRLELRFLEDQLKSGELKRLQPRGEWPEETKDLVKDLVRQKQFEWFDNHELRGSGLSLDLPFLETLLVEWESEVADLKSKEIWFRPAFSFDDAAALRGASVQEGNKRIFFRHREEEAVVELNFAEEGNVSLRLVKCTCGDEGDFCWFCSLFEEEEL
ncbi:hypothetical protein QR680_008945 [Steinernema hermaphroditum]|uniref:Uncharacterized protein n=1 Tax=Steinernema hermaphroditum TaxID=289476 RepID=A0AA39IIK2_9BILA|nr:hypothetical protein QR680_008945 [Steinernema hermaphroditum]